MTNLTTAEFPFQQRLSLRPLISFWQEKAEAGDASSQSFVRDLLAEVSEHAIVGSEDLAISDLAAESSVVDKLMSAVFPWATIDRHIAAAIVPFELTPFYATPLFEELDLLSFFDPRFNKECALQPGEMTHARTMKAYHLIIQRLYGAKKGFDIPFVVSKKAAETGLERFFQIDIDPRFVQVKVRAQKPRLKESDLEQLENDPMNLELWRQHLPAERFAFEGFGLIRAVEVTYQQVLSLIKNDLLDHRDFSEHARLEEVQGHLRSLLGKPDLEIGVIALETAKISELSSSRVVGRSLLLADNAIPECPRLKVSSYARAIEERKPVFMSDLGTSEEVTGLEWKVFEMGYGSMAVIPLITESRLVGLLELASRDAKGLTRRDEFQMTEVVQLLATALSRVIEEREHRIQALIKRRFTSIHPVVEWRFREAALRQMEEPGSPTTPIVFDKVFPLYGLSDVRNSSVFRATSIREDLSEQLGLALAVIIQASSHSPQPALDELGFQLGRHIDQLTDGESISDESEPLDLLKHEVEPLLDKLGAIDHSIQKAVAEYREAIDPELGVIYRKRKDFEVSMTMVNERISEYLEEREEQAQQLVPHYFEKYRTDGVDYNIYVGASLRKNQRFDQLDLRNLRLWQLVTMAGCALEAANLKAELPLALEVTHLILVQSSPLAIRFRPDEKKFDVDGAYNIRYEIVKKRIDKATIMGTGERLTQPGQIAIAYSLTSERREYLRYIDFLTKAGYLKPGAEQLALEPLQGVTGLRALRVTVADKMPETDFVVKFLSAELTLSED
ncbi:MAG: hypothetical protein ACI9W4_001814 [Rhodothermales bacterium]|jgi:hypothetical protein